MYIHNETVPQDIMALIADPLSAIERARSVSEFDRTSAPVAVHIPFRFEDTISGHVHFYANRATLDSDMIDMLACTYQSAIEVVEIAPDGTCTVLP